VSGKAWQLAEAMTKSGHYNVHSAGFALMSRQQSKKHLSGGQFSTPIDIEKEKFHRRALGALRPSECQSRRKRIKPFIRPKSTRRATVRCSKKIYRMIGQPKT
jgi:hypothetical protein